jgi:hypothetical protein
LCRAGVEAAALGVISQSQGARMLERGLERPLYFGALQQKILAKRASAYILLFMLQCSIFAEATC